MNIKFAPLNIPLERRLQTLAIVAYVIILILGVSTSIAISLYVLLYTEYVRWIYLGYLTWIFFDLNSRERGGRPKQWVRKWLWWKYLADYFPVHFIKLPSCELDPKKNYLLCCFPHGMMATGAFVSIATEARDISKKFPNHKIHMHTLKTNFVFPLLRELVLSLGLVSSSAESLNYILGRPEGGNLTALVIGGAQEAFYTKPHQYKLVLRNRKGFIKVALRNGSPLVPVMSFGEPDILSQVDFGDGSLLRRFQLAVKEYFGFVPIVPLGRGIFQYSFGLLPRRKEIAVVVGEPIDVVKSEKPTQEQIDNLHHEFITKLTQLFETEKKNYLKNYEKIHLEIV
ncbi:2-acylglycerol O-acyltransferase 1-like isoform X2 [Coccinella septempunctata]|nr:2-acylglycerol O-acyltransferase 1-like isoform X2 [Coccinella septempunctata]XP_044756817.1 2-acylglycerol O-acyltransferase 1-like isoform X2 [Coccinella septempunctata]